jgi:predicted nucleic acid-binding Zn ribbon protein
MPTYVYKFTDTGETIEIQQSFDEPTLTEARHPVDGTMRAVKKVFLPVGITFKGSGFYKTDSRGGSGSSSSSNSSASSSSASSSSATTDTSSSSSNGSAGASSGSAGSGSSSSTTSAA